MKKSIFKILSVFLLSCIFSLSLFSCASNENSETESDSAKESESSTEIVEETDAAGTITVFKNGAYVTRIVRSELADGSDKTAYNRIKAAFKSKTGKNAATSTDFVAAGATLDDSSAILVGKTDYAETKTVYDSLEKGQAVATVVNNKYVVAYSNTESLIKLLSTLEEKIASVSAEEIVIDSTWEIKVSVAALVESVKLPNFNGASLGEAIDIGQGSELYIISNTTQEKYAAYTTDLINLGFKLYTTNKIADNEYSTFITDTQIVNVMYLKNSQEVRITQDNRMNISLPGLSSENTYTATSNSSFTMMGISNTGYPGGMAFIYKLADGTFFIIDGGICANRTGSTDTSISSSIRLFTTLQALADDPNNIVISGWLITHVHNDHVGSFIDMADNAQYKSKVTVNKVIYSQPSDADMKAPGGNMTKRLNWIPDAVAKWNIKNVVKAHPGQMFYFADLKLTILGTHDLVKPKTLTSHNNASVVSMVEFGGKTALYLADSEGD